MKRQMLALALMVVLLGGCSGKDRELDRVMALRAKMLSSECSFDAEVTADYLDGAAEFGLRCRMEANGAVTFTVTEPESIAGITGRLDQEGGKLTFDGEAVAFPLLADGEVSPISAPWILTRTLRSGCLTSCGREGEFLRAAIDDSYEADALHLDIWLTEENLPCRGDITWKDRRILTVTIQNFTIL